MNIYLLYALPPAVLLANFVFLVLTVVLLVNTVSYALFCLGKSCRLYFYSNSHILHFYIRFSSNSVCFFPNKLPDNNQTFSDVRGGYLLTDVSR